MEETLRLLHAAMVAHRQAMAVAGTPPDEVEGAAAQTVALDRRGAAVQLLSRDIERMFGIEISGMMEAKLCRVLSSFALSTLEARVAHLHILPQDAPEWLSLIESLTVHETFFHRDQSQLDLLRRRLLPELIETMTRGHRHRMRVWSAGCATGEEAYTLAILALLALRDAGLAEDTPDRGIICTAPWQVDVLGSDISRVVLKRAETASYAAQELGAFRQLPGELERFFPPLPPGPGATGIELRGVQAAIRRHVRFGRFNLMAAAPPERGFDIVSCRNVLIYLTPTARATALSVVRQALRPGGYLVLGPTDAPADLTSYDAGWGDGAVAYRLKGDHG